MRAAPSVVVLNSLPSTGISRSSGTPLFELDLSSRISPPSATVSPLWTATVV